VDIRPADSPEMIDWIKSNRLPEFQKRCTDREKMAKNTPVNKPDLINPIRPLKREAAFVEKMPETIMKKPVHDGDLSKTVKDTPMITERIVATLFPSRRVARMQAVSAGMDNRVAFSSGSLIMLPVPLIQGAGRMVNNNVAAIREKKMCLDGFLLIFSKAPGGF
jgi:hypothetical protein